MLTVDRDALAASIVRLRRQRGWTQRYLAQVLGVNEWTVAAWEGARQVPGGGETLAMVRLGLDRIDEVVRGPAIG